MSDKHPWWRGAVIYQVYVRSFCDGNGDGQGDLAGLMSKLDYIASLGVDAIWLSPIHPSPDRDWGYDVSDFENVHRDYGTLDDFNALLEAVHARGMKVMLDEVLAHTSDEHPWFADSLNRGEKADWYVWADAKVDGTVSNNWLAVFGGPAWAYQPARRQYYHHKFLRQQPKLNWRNADARAAALDVLDLWLQRGVDGFRLDVANAYLHDAALTDNPPVEPRDAHAWSHAANMQHHFHDSNLVENAEALSDVRHMVERHPDRFVMGEFSEEPERSGCFLAPDEGLHSGYSFPLLEARKLGPEFIRAHFEMLARYPTHWPSVAFSNHDVMRTLTRFGGKDAPQALAKLMLALLFSLKGTALLYQGEELGLPQTKLGRDQLKDPVGDLYWPYTSGRDGCRTPMPWEADAPNLGFTDGEPWLPLSPAHRALAVSAQERDAQSTLSFAREFLKFRKSTAAFRWGEIELVDAVPPMLAFTRNYEGERILCLFNMSADECVRDLPAGEMFEMELGDAKETGGRLSLGPYAARFFRL